MYPLFPLYCQSFRSEGRDGDGDKRRSPTVHGGGLRDWGLLPYIRCQLAGIVAPPLGTAACATVLLQMLNPSSFTVIQALDYTFCSLACFQHFICSHIKLCPCRQLTSRAVNHKCLVLQGGPGSGEDVFGLSAAKRVSALGCPRSRTSDSKGDPNCLLYSHAASTSKPTG